MQLKQRDPELAITVLERRAHPVREAAFKVGESTVEIGAHYFADVLGLREHLSPSRSASSGFASSSPTNATTSTAAPNWA